MKPYQWKKPVKWNWVWINMHMPQRKRYDVIARQTTYRCHTLISLYSSRTYTGRMPDSENLYVRTRGGIAFFRKLQAEWSPQSNPLVPEEYRDHWEMHRIVFSCRSVWTNTGGRWSVQHTSAMAWYIHQNCSLGDDTSLGIKLELSFDIY